MTPLRSFLDKPGAGESGQGMATYIHDVDAELDALALMERQITQVLTFATGLTPEQEHSFYAPGKWSVREVLGHLADTERVMGYRLLWIARGATEPLAGFDEQTFVSSAGHDRISARALAQEWASLRQANLNLVRSLGDEAISRTGIANGQPISVRALIWVLPGHVQHHMTLFAERYGLTP